MNIEAGWNKSMAHFYDKYKTKYPQEKIRWLDKFLHEGIMNLPSEIEAHLFLNLVAPKKEQQKTAKELIIKIMQDKYADFLKEAEKEIKASQEQVEEEMKKQEFFDWSTNTLNLLLNPNQKKEKEFEEEDEDK